MRLRRHKDGAPEENERREPEAQEREPGAEPGSITGSYLTDGRSLFRVQHAITEADGMHLDEPLLELEDCATLELILCSAGALERLGLRPVDPAAEGDSERARRAGADEPLTTRPVRL